MPAALYQLCQDDKREHIRVTANVIMPTQRQTKDYLLCAACEDNLNKNGERYVIPLLSRLDAGFPLYERLAKLEPTFSNQMLTVYPAADRSDIDVPKLIHFGIGIFWKASVHSFGSGEDGPRIDIGSDSEALRLYLRGEVEAPDHIVLAIAVESDPLRYPAIIDPTPGQNPNFKSIFFYVPGMRMQLYIGAGVRAAKGEYAINVNPQCPILAVPLAKDMRSSLHKHSVRAHQTRNLQKKVAEIEARGLNRTLGE